jgi:putative aminopeptidase FrvX
MIISTFLILLQSLVNLFGPCGQENEVRNFCQKTLEPLVDEMWVDPAGNLIGKIYGEDSESQKSIRLVMHMDEISLMVKEINDNGTLSVLPLGGIYPFSSGQGPVEILGDNENIKGILSFGSVHLRKDFFLNLKDVSRENQWKEAVIITRKSLDELKKAGIHPGSRIVQARSRRQLEIFEDCIGGYFLDNRAGLATALYALKQLKENNQKPKRNVYFIASCTEECGAFTASYASRVLPGDITIAIDTCPIVGGISENPIIVYKDLVAIYDKTISDHLVCLAKELNQDPKYCVVENGGTDASLALNRGQSARSAFIGIPVENCHGFEVIHKDSIPQCAKLLLQYLLNPEN